MAVHVTLDLTRFLTQEVIIETKDNSKVNIVARITVYVERVAGLNIHGFSPMKFFAEILLQCIGHQCSLLT